MRWRPRLTLAIAAACLVPPSVAFPQDRSQPGAAPKPSRYVPFPFDGDIEGQVLQHLKDAEQSDKLRKLMEDLLRNQDFKFDPETLERLKAKDPATQKQLKDWVKKRLKEKDPDLAELKRLQKQLMEEMKKPPPEEDELSKIKIPPDLPPPPPPPPEPEREPTRDWMKTILEDTQKTKLGEALQDSPAFKKAIEELQRPGPKSGEGLGLDLEKLAERFQKLKFGDGQWGERLASLKPANLPQWSPAPPAVTRPGLPSFSAPSLPAASALGTIALWLLLLALAALVLWQLSRWLRTSTAPRTPAADLGPWPVDPKLVATRAELVRAFDYLTLLVFGRKARPWNHRAVARSLAQRTEPLAATVAQLAGCYEQARYTEGDEALPADVRDQVRLALSQLAETAAP
jgi:hypothetical protein